jgi:hypothetical protein
MRKILAGLVLIASGCSDQGLVIDNNEDEVPEAGSITGRVCDPSGRTWLADAMAYTNIYDDTGTIIDVAKAYSDRDGYWTLPELASEREYTIYVQYGNDVLMEETLWLGAGEDIKLDEPDCFDPLALDIAVITGDYDDIHVVLESMGFANYTLVDGNDLSSLTGFLTNIETMRQYDLIFFNGGSIEKGVFYDTNPANDTPDQVISNIQQYVQEGGSVYATDWSYDVVELAWEDRIDWLGDDRVRDGAQLGEYDLVDAMVTDEALSAFLTKTSIEIDYDLPVWPPINNVDPTVSIHLTGTVHYSEGQSTYTLASVPLLVSFSDGEGRVGFSTFRIAANHKNDMVLTLQYMMHKL